VALSKELYIFFCGQSRKQGFSHEFSIYLLKLIPLKLNRISNELTGIYSNKMHVRCILQSRDSLEVPNYLACSLWKRGGDDINTFTTELNFTEIGTTGTALWLLLRP